MHHHSDLTDVNKRKSTAQLKKPSRSRRPRKKPRLNPAADGAASGPTTTAPDNINNAANQSNNNAVVSQQQQQQQQGPNSNNNNASNSTNVASHYNKLSEQSRHERQASQIIHLRSFNNWCKSVLISKYVRSGDMVLDFCCGKGGDLSKYMHANVKEWHGVDIAEESVDQALQRYQRMDTSFRASFYVGDVSKIDLPSQLPPDVQFDATSCQFALHYSWQNEESARTFLRNATSKLKANGHFIVTTTDGYVLKQKLMASSNNVIRNSIMEAEFDKKDTLQSDGYYGIRYVFSLKERIDKCPEYLVHPRELVRLADEFGLDVIENLNFHHFYQKYAAQYSELTNRFKIMDNDMGEDEWDTIYLYRVFVFRKRMSTQPASTDNTMQQQQNAYYPAQQNAYMPPGGDAANGGASSGSQQIVHLK